MYSDTDRYEMLKRIEKAKDNYTRKHGVIPNKIKMSPTLYMMFNGKEKIADMYIVVTTELDYVFELAYEIYLNKGEEDSVNNKLDLSSIPTILQEIYKEIEALKEQGKTPTNVLMSERTYKTISPDYEVGEITGCFGLPLEISNSIRKYQVCFDKNEDKGEDENMKKLRTIDLLNKILNKEKVGTQYKNTYNGEILDTKNSSNINLESLLNPYLQDTNKRIGWFENYLLEEWEEVEEPVTFMDAMVEHFKKHKTIYCLIDSKKYTYPWRGGEYKEMKSNEGGSLCAKEILEGKWYIEP